jgi:hypothetical protein
MSLNSRLWLNSRHFSAPVLAIRSMCMDRTYGTMKIIGR